jgi:hypothetical protein
MNYPNCDAEKIVDEAIHSPRLRYLCEVLGLSEAGQVFGSTFAPNGIGCHHSPPVSCQIRRHARSLIQSDQGAVWGFRFFSWSLEPEADRIYLAGKTDGLNL